MLKYFLKIVNRRGYLKGGIAVVSSWRETLIEEKTPQQFGGYDSFLTNKVQPMQGSPFIGFVVDSQDYTTFKTLPSILHSGC